MTTQRIALTILLVLALSLGAGWASWTYLFNEDIDKARTAALEHVRALHDEQLKAELRAQISSLYSLKRRAQTLPGESYRTEYIDDQTTILRQQPDLQELTRAWLDGTVFDSYPGRNDTIQMLTSNTPFSLRYNSELQFPYSLEWHSITLDNGQVLEALDSSARPDGIWLHKWTTFNRLDLKYPQDQDDRPAPVTMNGKAEVVIPRSIRLFHFSKSEVGTTQQDGNLSVKLLSVGDNHAEVELINRHPPAANTPEWALTPMSVHAQDHTNRYLATLGSLKADQAEMRLYERQLRAAMKQSTYQESFFNEQHAERLAFKRMQRKYRHKIYFRGSVENITVIALDLSDITLHLQDLAAPVYQLESRVKDLEFRAYPAPTVIHDESLPAYLSDYDISEEEQRQRISFYQEAESSRNAVIRFDNGAPFNWRVAGRTNNQVNFYSRSESGAREPIEGVSQHAFSINIYDQNIRYYLPNFSNRQRPAYASGTMPLVRPEVKRFEYAADALPENLELKDNALLIQLHDYPEQRWRFYARDSNGKYLLQMFEASHTGDDSKPLYKALYFYGQPASIDAYFLAEVHRLNYDFDIELREPEHPCYASDHIMMAGCL